MNVVEITAKSILRKNKYIDSWFVSRYGMNLYQGCTHDCVYCDGRAEKYNVQGDFENDIKVKINAPQLLERALDPARKRVPMKRGYVMICGGVSDAYQPVEKKYQITRKALEIIEYYGYPVHILTKSILVKRDIDILKRINEKNRAIISFSFSSANDEVSRIFEPGVPPPSKRLEMIRYLRKEGLHSGIYYMPVIPFITDSEQFFTDTVSKAKQAGAEFMIFGGMTLKAGRQHDYFYNVLKKHYPQLIPRYDRLYSGLSRWGEADKNYYIAITNIFNTVAAKYRMPKRIPAYLFNDIIDDNDLVTVILSQLDYLATSKGLNSPYGAASYAVAKLDKPIADYRNELTKLKGVGQFTEKLINEILDTKTAAFYEKLLL